eukprot:gene22033-29096_t
MIMIMGGTQGVGAGTQNNLYYEIWDQNNPDETKEILVNRTYLNRVKQNYYPFNFVLPTGDMFNFAGRHGTIMVPMTGGGGVGVEDYVLPTGDMFNFAGRRGTIMFPFTGTGCLLALLPENNYHVEVIIFGGANEDATRDLDMEAGRWSHRMSINPPTKEVPEYTFGDGWFEEEMAAPRVMGDSILLPNGQVVILNGAKTGLAGDSASGGESRANYPNLWAELYDPYAPAGERYTLLNKSDVARMYHSTCILTTNGTILVSGCDRCNPFLIKSDEPFIPAPAKAEYRALLPSIQVKAEYRVEIFYPPFWFDIENKPRIVKAEYRVELIHPQIWYLLVKAEYRVGIFYPPFWFDIENKPRIVKAEYRVEIFYPPFWFDIENKPRIVKAEYRVELIHPQIWYLLVKAEYRVGIFYPPFWFDIENKPRIVKAEYRVEIFYPPFWFDIENKPRIVTSPLGFTFREEFDVWYAGENSNQGKVTSAVLVAPSSTTHSFNMNQRVVGLQILSDNKERQRIILKVGAPESEPALRLVLVTRPLSLLPPALTPIASTSNTLSFNVNQIVVGLQILSDNKERQKLTLKAPPNANIAPAQQYMLFLLNGETYSRAVWVHLE